MIRKARLPGRWKTGALAVTVSTLVLAGVATGIAGDSAVRAKTPSESASATVHQAVPVGFSHIIERVSPAVVSIQVRQSARADANFEGGRATPSMPDGMEEFLRRFFGEDRMRQFEKRSEEGNPRWRPMPRQRQGAGSGFIVDPAGYIVTNDHVIRGASRITVVRQGGKTHEAKLVGRDSLTDLALLKIEAGEDLPFVEFNKDDTPKVGDWVVTIGNPFGLGHTVTAGIVSAHHRSIGHGPYDDFIQIDAPINRGNSGGPAFNTAGSVIGVNTAIFSPTGGSVGIGFAIPASTARDVIAKLKDDGRVERGWLGVQIQAVTEDVAESLGLDTPKGALVAKVTADSPAEKGGVRQGDLILSVNGKEVSSVRVLPRLVAAVAPGRAAQLTVLRRGKERKLTVQVGARPDAPQVAAAPENTKPAKTALGLRMQSLDPTVRQQFGIGDDVKGVVITEVNPNSRAAEKGLSAGDVIVEIGNQPVTTPAQVAERIQEADRQDRKSVLLLVRNASQQRFVALPLRKA